MKISTIDYHIGNLMSDYPALGVSLGNLETQLFGQKFVNTKISNPVYVMGWLGQVLQFIGFAKSDRRVFIMAISRPSIRHGTDGIQPQSGWCLKPKVERAHKDR